MHRVLVTDAEQRSSLAVVRSLGRAGYDVEVCSARQEPLAGASRYSAASHVVPDPGSDVQASTDELARLVDQRRIDVLVPMTDVTASIALSLRDTHPELVLPFPPRETYEKASDKHHLMDVAARLDVPTPAQVVVNKPSDDLEAAHAFAQDVGFPVILKPHRSAVVTESGVQKFGVSLAASPEDLEQRLRSYSPGAFPILVQERVQGPGLGGFFLARTGRMLAEFAHHRLREKPPTGGVSVLRRGVPLRSDLRQYSEALLHHLEWSGVAMVEFKEDAESGTLYLMEINARFWGSLQLAIDCGVDFPRLLLESFLNEGTGETTLVTARRKVESRWLWGDVDHLLWILRARGGYRVDHPELPGRLGATGRFLLPWRPGRRYEVLQATDVGPFLRESRQWISQTLLRRPPR